MTGGNGAASHGPAGSDERQAPADDYEGRVTPAVRRLAREHEIDLSLVPGTGHAGRVTREDVLAYVERGGPAPPSRRREHGRGSGPRARRLAAAAAPRALRAPMAATTGRRPRPTPSSRRRQMRKAIAAQMTRALQVPHAYTTIEVDMSAVVRHREANKRAYQAREGMSLSYVAFVTKATVEALRRHPDMNAHWTDEGPWRRKAINVGIAVAVDDGLVVPVIRDADRLSIHGLNRAINELADRARTNRLRLDDIQGGTFTVDNTGWTGSHPDDAHHQRAGGRHRDHGGHRQAAGRHRDAAGRRHRRPLDDEHGPGHRPPRHRRRPGRRASSGRHAQWLESVDESTSIW